MNLDHPLKKHFPVSPELSLDKTESATQWFDELEAKRDKEDLQGGQAGGSDLCVHIHADSPAPLLLRYPVWEKSFHEYGWGI